MDSGYILLARSILDSDVFASQKLLKIWIWCLCKANFKDRSVPLKIGKGETIVNVKRGSFIFGRNKAEEELFIDGSTIYKSMQKLELMDMIKIQSNNQYSIVTICKYNEYQQNDNYKVTSNEQPSNNQVTSNEQPSNTTNTLPKDKKDKKDIIKESVFSFEDFWNVYPTKKSKAEAERKYKNISEPDRLIIKNTITSFINDKPFKDYTHPHPTTYINQKRWLDNVGEVKKEIPPFEFDFKKHGGDLNLFNKLKLEHERKYS